MSKIIWKNVDSTTIPGLLVTEVPPITKPKMKTNITKIDGKDGDIIEELGYESYSKTLKIALTNNYDINQVIKYFTGEGDLIISNELDKVYKSKIIEKIDYDKLLRFKTASVKFYTQPYKYLNDESTTDLTITDETSLIINNQGLEKSKPIITLFGEGTITIAINTNEMFRYTFPEGETSVTIDSMEEEAYESGVYKNRNMLGEFPILDPGNNTIAWGGTLTRIIVQPKSRWL